MKIVLIMIRKVGLYILSLWLLFLLSIILTIDIPMYWGNDWIFIGIGELLKRNIVPLISVLGLIIGAISYVNIKRPTHKVGQVYTKIDINPRFWIKERLALMRTQVRLLYNNK